jgi:spore coat polysaccharide biosynthesis predicted glycosyltransferase SpsG
MRCLALAEELAARGVTVLLVGNVDEPAWVRSEVEARRVRILPVPDETQAEVDLLTRHHATALIIDSYAVPPELSKAAQQSGIAVALVADGDPRGHEPDLLLDQNAGAERSPVYRDVAPITLLGLDYVLLRDAVRFRRPAAAQQQANDGPVRVLAFFGGTDAKGTATHIAPLILSTGTPLELCVVARDPDTAAALTSLPRGRHQSVTVIRPGADIAEKASRSDLVVSASGTSAWELFCLGRATALVCVADNQRPGYEAATAAGLASGLGYLDQIAHSGQFRQQAVAMLGALLGSADLRSALAERAWAAVDGRGRERVANTLLGLVGR